MTEIGACDIAIVGGGLAGGLIALALAEKRPELDVRLIEASEAIGGNHIWSFFASDLGAEEHRLLAPLASHAWEGYHVLFPKRRRRLDESYFSVESAQLDAAVRAAVPDYRLFTECPVAEVEPEAVTFKSGHRIAAKAVIDARGAGDLSQLDVGWQKFVGRELHIEGGHKLKRPIVMDATVEQLDGFRFVYCLPFSAERVLVEDTYYSDSPELDVAAIDARITDYAAWRGWVVEAAGRRETGALPVAMGGDFDAYWRSGGAGVPKAGLRAGLFHPLTGYSLPDAARTACLIAGQRDLSSAGLHELLYGLARRTWEERRFYRMLARMLFRAAEPGERYRVLQRFYAMKPGLIRRFYAARSTRGDKFRLLAGRPPVPLARALGVLRERRA